jgi:hypothetical protein
MSDENIVYKYKFVFEDGKDAQFNLTLDPKTLLMQRDIIEPYPEWTELEFNKCPHCPVDPRLEKHCPVALNLMSPISIFQESLSYEKADVYIASNERKYMKPTTIQEGLSSLIGLCMATSGCPYLDYLKPMVRFHLPFASSEETMYRVLTMYMFAQHMRMKRGEEPDWDLKNLDGIYDNIRQVNKTFTDRLRHINVRDAALNALVNLDCFAISVKFSINYEMLEDVTDHFGAYMQ